MYTKSDIAIVILNWNGEQLLQKFLPSVIRHSGNSSIYVIDNGSTDNSVSLLKSSFPSIKLIILKDNYGYAGGYNNGIIEISESIICCLNSDVEVTKNWLEPIITAYNTDSKLAIAQPKLLDFNEKSYFEYAGAAGGFIDKFGYPYCHGRVFDYIEVDKGQYNKDHDIFWASGACLFIKKNVFRELGGFDERFFAHMEEIDLCWRAFNSELKVRYIADSHVLHVGGSTLKNSSPQKTFLNFRNSLMTLFKNSPNPFILVLVRLLLDGIAGLRFLIKGQVYHFVAIIKAHISFYFNIFYIFKQRKLIKNKRKDYYLINSIVWDFFIAKKYR